MGVLKISSLFVFTCWVLSLRLEASCDCPAFSLKLLQVPYAMSNRSSATFKFESYFVTNGEPCTACNFTCKLDHGNFSECEDRKVTYGGLLDGNHSFKVCSNGSAGLGCACYNWTIDTVPPTVSLTSSTSFTNALNFTVNVSFSETCSGGGGFRCPSVEGCNLHVLGAGQVVPSSLRILQPNLTYSLLVSLNSTSNGSLILVMEEDVCSDSAGNTFMQTNSSILSVNYDRRRVSVDLTTPIPEQTVQLEGQVWTVQATNDYDHLKIYLNFSQPILNSSAGILNSLNISTGSLVPIPGNTLGNRTFGFKVTNVSSMAVVTITMNSIVILTVQGTAVSPMAPVTFLYDTERPAVRLNTDPLRTKERNIPVSIEFTEPVFGFNVSNIVISGGRLHSFLGNSQSKYNIEIEAESESDIVSVHVNEDVTADVAGNKNTASDPLHVRHYTIPTLSRVVSTTATSAFLATSFAAGLLSITTASLQSLGAFTNPSSFVTSEPSRNLFRMVCHIQVFALSRWLPVVLPVEYYEFARGIQWTIPYFSLPWEAGHIRSIMPGSNPPSGSKTFITRTVSSETYANTQPNQDKLGRAPAVNRGLPLNPKQIRSFFKSTNNKSEAQCIYDPQNANGWRDFDRNMLWLAVIGGGLMLLHALLLLIFKSKKKNNENQRDYGALSFPRFEIFMLILVLPCICQASANVIRGGTTSGIVVGILLLGLVSFALLTLLLFLSSGITYGKLVQYKEDRQGGQRHHWYQELVRVTLGPGERGQWTWKNQQNSNHLIMFGPLFEDLRGPQISGSNPREGDRKDETEDAEAPFIQKLFSILRIYYPLLESIKRVSLGIIAGAYSRNRCSRTPTITLMGITAFQLFFLVLKKPFISKRVQLVEIISVSTEVGLFASSAVLPRRESSATEETSRGFSMVMLFLVGFVAQMVNEWCALFLQTKRLDQNHKSFSSGLKVASRGLVSIFLSSDMIQDTESISQTDQPVSREPVDTSSSADRNRSSSSRSLGTNKPRLRYQRDLGNKDQRDLGNKAPTDPLSSIWSGFWGCIRNESLSSSMNEAIESMSQTNQLESKETADTSSSADRNRSSSSRSSGTNKPRLRHQRDLGNKAPTDPSSSIWSSFWGCIRNESLPSSVIQDVESMIPTDQPESREPADTSSSVDRNRSSSSRSSGTDKPRLRHQSDLAKPSFSKEGIKAPTDPSSSIWSGFWGCIRSKSLPSSTVQDTKSMIPTDQPESREPADTSSSADRNRSFINREEGLGSSRDGEMTVPST